MGGDMRRVLNLLQSTAMSLSGATTETIDMEIDGDDGKGKKSGSVDETSVYMTSGSPLPSDIEAILTSLLNDTFRDSCEKISKMCTTKGYALADVLKELTPRLCAMKGLDALPLGKILDGMSQVECRLAMREQRNEFRRP